MVHLYTIDINYKIKLVNFMEFKFNEIDTKKPQSMDQGVQQQIQVPDKAVGYTDLKIVQVVNELFKLLSGIMVYGAKTVGTGGTREEILNSIALLNGLSALVIFSIAIASSFFSVLSQKILKSNTSPNVDKLSENMCKELIENGKKLVKQILEGEKKHPDNDPSKASSEAAAIMWYLKDIAFKKMENFSEGTFVLEDPKGLLYNFFKSGKGVYERLSSHFSGRSESMHLGWDIFNGLLPDNKRTLLFEQVSLRDGSKQFWIKPENYSANPDELPDYINHAVEWVESQINKRLYSGKDKHPTMRKERIPADISKKFNYIMSKLDSSTISDIKYKLKLIATKDLKAEAEIWGIAFMHEVLEITKNQTLSLDKEEIKSFYNRIQDHKADTYLKWRTGREVILEEKELLRKTDMG